MSEDSIQTDTCGVASSEKVIGAAEWLPIDTSPTEPMLSVIIAGQYDNGVWYVEEGFRNPLGHWNGRKINPPSHWMPLPAPPNGQVNFSNESERTDVSLNQTTPKADSQ